MVEPSHFLEYGIESEEFEPIQYDLISEVVLVDNKHHKGFYMIEFLYIDDQADVWIFTDNNERLLAYEYALLSIELNKVVNKIYAKLN